MKHRHVLLVFLLMISLIQAAENPDPFWQDLTAYLQQERQHVIPSHPVRLSMFEKYRMNDIKFIYSLLDASKASEEDKNRLLGHILMKKYRDNDDCPLSDENLLTFVMGLFKRGYGPFLGFFETSMLEARSDEILSAFKTKKYNLGYTILLPIEFLRSPKLKEFNKSLVAYFKQEAIQNPKCKDSSLEMRARLGDEEAKSIMFQQAEKVLAAKDVFECRRMVGFLLSMEDHEANIILLKFFQENIGAPDYFAERTVRYMILKGLYLQYPRDDFFIKNRPYFTYGLRTCFVPLDEDYFKGEKKIKVFLEDFRDWAKKRLKYEIDMNRMEYKICLSYRTIIDFSPD